MAVLPVCPVPHDQLALAPANRNEGVNSFYSCLQRHRDGCTIDNCRGWALDWQTLCRREGRVAVQGSAQWIDDSAIRFHAHRHIEHFPCPLHFIACVEVGVVVVQQHYSDLAFLDIKRYPV